MLSTVVKKIFGSRNERTIRRHFQSVAGINAFEKVLQPLSDEALKAKSDEFRQRIQAGEDLDKLLPEVFATVREASVRTLGLRHFDVQMIGGIVLHSGRISEMRTGEGKTLVATLPAYLNALTDKGVHVVTVNDYLAQRDANWMRPVFEFLGMSVGVNLPDMSPEEKRAAYACDITYGTNNEFGFDYLRDNMAFELEEQVQRPLHYAIVDEVDSILIDEARTPLIISGAAEDSSVVYIAVDKLVPHLTRQETEESAGDYFVDEKSHQVYLNENGHQKVEELLTNADLLKAGDSLYNASNIGLMHHVNSALRAHALYQRDVEYIVSDGEIVIVDEHTGRTMPGRRWSEGLHQAVEAKEGVKIQNENQTLASTTFQNYFRIYEKLSGMTGTADTEAYEFQQIYNLEVVVIPTNKPMLRQDLPDLVYLNQTDKFKAIIEDIVDCSERNQPVLVGTTSIETSELLSQCLDKEKIKHNVLNAKFHEKEAEIIVEAGRPGIVTIATNMAGRGTDIVLGGNLTAELTELGEDASDEEKQKLRIDWEQRHNAVLEAGGLRIIGSERHESRRIDNQLRGRSGRQGDPGSSRFYLSLEDNLMRIFASDRVSAIMQKLGMQDGEAIEHPWVTKAIENAQRKVEGRNFDIRKQLLEYDNVANDQRQVIYEQRSAIMNTDDTASIVAAMHEDVVQDVINQHIAPESMEEQWDVPGLEHQLESDFGLKVELQKLLEDDDHMHEETLRQHVSTEIRKIYEGKEELAGKEVMQQFEKAVLLQALDQQWRDHLAAMDHLRQGIHLRSFAQKDPKQEYKREAFDLFTAMLDRIKHNVLSIICTVQIEAEEDIAAIEEQRRADNAFSMNYQHSDVSALQQAVGEEGGEEHVQQVVRDEPKVGRNDPCPCGSGKKYKQCHGTL